MKTELQFAHSTKRKKPLSLAYPAILALLSAGFLQIFSIPSAAEADLKLATVDMAKAFSAHPRVKEVEEQMRREREAVKAELDRKVAVAKQAIEEKSDEAPALEREAKEFQKAKELELQSGAKTQREKIVRDIKDALKEVQRADGYQVIFDVSGNSMNGVPVVSVAETVPDVTPKVITRLTKKQ